MSPRPLGPSLGPGQNSLDPLAGVAGGGFLVPPIPAKRLPDILGEFEDAHLVTQKEVDPVQLQEDLVRRLGKDVTVTMRLPSDTEPGYLRVQDVRNGADLNVDPAVLDEVLAENASPESTGRRFLREFDAAETQDGKLLALRDYIARDIAEDEHRHVGQQRMHIRMARAYEARKAAEQKKMLNPATGQLVTVTAL